MFLDSLNGEYGRYHVEDEIDLVQKFEPEDFLENTVRGYKEIKEEAVKRKLI